MRLTLNWLAALVLLLIAPAAGADDWSPITHCDRAICVVIDAGDGPPPAPELAIYIDRSKHGAPDYSKLLRTLDFAKECKRLTDTGDIDAFRCRTNKRNPLSGATYKEVNTGEMGDCGPLGDEERYEYLCIGECKTAPRHLDVELNCD